MPRIHAVELEDLPGFPAVIRDAGTAYLRFAAETTGQAASIEPVIEDALERSGEDSILDLCSGGGGPAVSIVRELWKTGREVRLTLTDLYPSESLRRFVDDLAHEHAGRIRVAGEPVDATSVPHGTPGLRTFFNALHHFRPSDATRVLADAIRHDRPIAVVEVLQRSPLSTIGMLFAPFVVLLTLPFLRPFRPAWIPLTYLVPIIPFFVMWDGLISSLRVHTPDELRAMIAEADPDGRFDWRFQEIPMKPSPVPGLALVGVPKSARLPTAPRSAG